MKITKRQLRKIIREEKTKLLKEQGDFGGDTLELGHLQPAVYSQLEDVVMENIPPDVDFLTLEEWAGFEKSVFAAMEELRDRIVGDPRGMQ